MSKPEDATAQPIDWGLSNLPVITTVTSYVVAVLAPHEFERLVEAISDRVIQKMGPPDWRERQR